MTTKTISIAVSCKHCGATVMIKKQGIHENNNLVSAVGTEMCSKCHKTSSYMAHIKNGQFTDVY